MVAVKHPEVTRLLLERGADPNADCDGESSPALLRAALWEVSESCEILLRHGAEVNRPLLNDGTTALLIATQKKDHETCKVLLRHGADANSSDDEGTMPMHLAVEGDIEIVKLLLAHGADVNCAGTAGYDDPLQIVVDGGSSGALEMAALLLQYGADPNRCTDWGVPPLYTAARNGKDAMCELLIGYGAEMNCIAA